MQTINKHGPYRKVAHDEVRVSNKPEDSSEDLSRIDSGTEILCRVPLSYITVDEYDGVQAEETELVALFEEQSCRGRVKEEDKYPSP